MDDNKFDDLIKNKVGEYEPPGFDPSAMADLHYRMGAGYSAPWYRRYGGELATAAASLAIAIALLWGQKKIGEMENLGLRSEIEQLQRERTELKEIQDMVKAWDKAPDTVRVVEYRNTEERRYQRLMAEIEGLKGQLARDRASAFEGAYPNTQLVYLGREEELPSDALTRLKRDGTVVKRGQHLFLLATNDIQRGGSPWLARRKAIVSEHLLPEYQFVLDTSYTREDIVVSRVIEKPVEISIKQMQELEKHYRKGIGIKLGPIIDFYNGRYDVGDGETAWGGGVMADFIVSPSLSLETGITYQGRIFEAETLDGLSLPSPDPQRGEFEEVEINSKLFEFPLNLRYRRPLNYRSNFITSLGVSGLLFTKQTVEYVQQFDAGDDIEFPVESSFHVDEPRFSFGTLNASLGLNRKLKNEKEIEISLFYKYGLGEMGLEQVNADFFGLRGAYWFTIKK